MIQAIIKQFNGTGEIYLRIKVRPGAAATAVKEVMADETIKIDVSAPPLKAKANSGLIKYLAKQFDVDKNCVKIISGAGERLKLIKIVRNYR